MKILSRFYALAFTTISQMNNMAAIKTNAAEASPQYLADFSASNHGIFPTTIGLRVDR
jgi:hypothetical protein